MKLVLKADLKTAHILSVSLNTDMDLLPADLPWRKNANKQTAEPYSIVFCLFSIPILYTAF